MHMSNLAEMIYKAVCTMRREETKTGTMQITALVKVPHAKRSCAKPFNEWAVPAYITAVTAVVPLAFSPK